MSEVGREERWEVVVEPGQVALDGGDGDLPGRRLVGAAHEGGRPDPARVVQGHGLGDPAPKGVPGDVDGAVPAQMVEQGHGVAGHLVDGVGRRR
jgi:hypothetical protein